ncbi:MAG: fibrinogen-like YCDxxxxGGGW domain-containing protein [Bradymonadia bacterium]
MMAFKWIVMAGATACLWTGVAQAQTATSCSSILRNGLSVGDGVYTIDPDGVGGRDAFDVYCDMTTNGGGWAMLYNSVGDPGGQTTAFWNIPFAERFDTKGTAAEASNFYAGSLYLYGTEYRDEITDLGNTTVEAFQATVQGFNSNTMNFTSPTRVSGNDTIYSCQFAGSWASPDYPAGGNCATSYSNVSQHYCGCWHYSLGSNAETNRFDSGWGPHLQTSVASTLGLSNDGTAYSRVNRIVRWARWDDGQIIVPDADGDGVNDDVDNCPNAANADQADGDADGVGDVCDACPADATNDADGDSVCQDVDNCPTVANADQADDNGDGYGDACVSPLANIPETATLGNDIVIGPDAVIGTYAQIGDGATVNGSVGNSAVIGAGSVVPAGVTVGNGARLGANVGLSSGCSVGVLAQLGDNITAGMNCAFGSKAEVGAGSTFGNNTSVGTLAIVGDGSSFADGATLGNNSQVGASADLLAGSTIGSNTRVGHTLSLGAGAIIEGNTEIGDEAIIGAGGIVRSYVTIGNSLAMGAGAEFAAGSSAGDDATVGENTEIRGEIGNNVTLEDRVFIGNQSSVGDNSHMHHDTTLGIFVTVGSGVTIHDDSALFDGVTLGDDSTVGERTTILFRSTIGARASIGDDVILDEQNTVGTDLVLGNNSRLWPRSTYGNNVNIGANVLIRDTADIGSDVTIEDDVIIFPETTIGEETIIRQGVELGVAVCETQVCGQVTIGGCRDVAGNIGAGGSNDGSCETGLIIDIDTGAREWADNTYATSCNEYRNPSVAPYTYVDNIGDGLYTIDPDGLGGIDPFIVTCDMTTDGGGWTRIGYSADLAFTQHFGGSDARRWLPSDFSLELSDAEINAIRAVSSEGKQTYVGQCRGVLHYFHTSGNNYAYAAGFEFQDGTVTPNATANIGNGVTVTTDDCRLNDNVNRTTVFEIDNLAVPVVNINTRDNGNSGEHFGSPLTSNPAWMR